MSEKRITASRRGLLGGAAVGLGALPGGAVAAQPDGALALSQFAGADEQRLLAALAEAGASRNGGLGQTVALPRGRLEVSAPFNTPDRVSLVGVNKRGSVIAPSRGFGGDCLVTATRGRLSMFDNALERLTLDCNDVAGLSGVVADAWQEGGGLRSVLIEKFTARGVHIRNGYGGAAMTLIDNTEIMGSAVIAANCGVYVEKVSATGNFVLNITNSTLSGSPGAAMDHGVYLENDSLHATSVHFEEVRSGVYLDGGGHHVLANLTGASTVTNLVEIAATFTGSLEMHGCARWGAANLLKDNRAGGLGTIAYDTRVIIDREPPAAVGANVAGGNFNGALRSPNIDRSFGVSRIVKTAAGDYTISLSRPGVDANSFSVIASTNTAGGTVTCALVGVGSVRLVSRTSSGVAADANEIKFLVTRVA